MGSFQQVSGGCQSSASQEAPRSCPSRFHAPSWLQQQPPTPSHALDPSHPRLLSSNGHHLPWCNRRTDDARCYPRPQTTN
ncbi:hypothetical protein V6N12_025706 [Hibiscus sabdariffa]|uniref:Uncharacterized protein n=1 Tax=Hibiscus sabdariffa TaxID=183260 RepID=A0ABR2ASY4_9ROSI